MAIILLSVVTAFRINSVWKLTAVCALFGLFVFAAFAPARVYAGDAQQIEVCNTNRTSSDAKCNSFINDYVNPIIKVLTAMVGVAAVISIIIAGIQYSASADDSGMVAKAKQRIFNVIIGLVAYVFLLALLNYLVPGGIW